MSPTAFGLEPFSDDEAKALDFLGLNELAPPKDPYPEPGEEIAGFVLKEVLGRGGMGVVYLATQPALGRDVALKVMMPKAGLTAVEMERVAREGHILATLRHPSIVAVHAAGSYAGWSYLAMDLVQGHTLDQLFRGEAPAFPQPGQPEWLPFLLPILHQIVDALAIAHARGVIHRDVKPSNVIVDGDGRPVLLDFGLAKEWEHAGVAQTVGFVGTPRYASPEQARCEPLTAATDVFSFGALAFEAVTGTPAFPGTTTQEVFQRIQYEDPVWPKNPRVPTDLRAVIDKCLEKNIANSYASAVELEQEFSRLLRFEPVLAVSRGRISRAVRRILRHPAKRVSYLGFGGLGAVALLALGFGMVHQSSATRFQAEALYESAMRHYLRGELAEARALLEQVDLSLDAPPSAAAGRLADLYLLQRAWTKAESFYLEELERDPDSLAGHLGLLMARSLPKPPPDLDADFDCIPRTARDHGILAKYHGERGEVEDGLAAIEDAIRMEPGFWAWHQGRGKLLVRQGELRAALPELELASQMAPKHRGVVRTLANVLFDLDENARSIRTLEQALRQMPGNPLLQADLARILVGIPERRPEALAIAREAHATDPEDVWVTSVLGRCLALTGSPGAAEALLADALADHPDAGSLHMELGWLSLRCGDTDTALRHALAMISIPRPSPALRLDGNQLLLWVQKARGNDEGALQAASNLEKLDPSSVKWQIEQALLLSKLGRTREAEEALARGDPSSAEGPEPFHVRATICRANGRPWEAYDFCIQALGSEPEHRPTLLLLVEVLLDLDQAEMAKHYLDRAEEAGASAEELERLRHRYTLAMH